MAAATGIYCSDPSRDYCLSKALLNPLDSIVDKIDSHGGLEKV